MATIIDEPRARDEINAPDDEFYEIVDGKSVEKKMSAESGRIASLISQHLGGHVIERRLGRVVTELLFALTEDGSQQRQPDVAFVSYEKWPQDRHLPRTNAWAVVPNLAIEVVSPTNNAEELVRKINDYFQYGVEHVWVIYPNVGQSYVYDSPTRIRVIQRGEELDGAPLCPDFRVPLATLLDT